MPTTYSEDIDSLIFYGYPEEDPEDFLRDFQRYVVASQINVALEADQAAGRAEVLDNLGVANLTAVRALAVGNEDGQVGSLNTAGEFQESMSRTNKTLDNNKKSAGRRAEDNAIRCFLNDLLRKNPNNQPEDDYDYDPVDDILDSLTALTLNSVINTAIKRAVKKLSSKQKCFNCGRSGHNSCKCSWKKEKKSKSKGKVNLATVDSNSDSDFSSNSLSSNSSDSDTSSSDSSDSESDITVNIAKAKKSKAEV
ncbi:hypothetical protein RclHR1_25330003 [Rhizophagus clarus]|uniref:CCHC-type domain-containing protein n=1 Tax=Rhizophagus clarus TaxID=94130 RepID=A0A2Z6R0I9_9GLOM|nr:hypothetical protein RclHR1_25330003 [Rhizophagus clarus]